MGQCPSLTRPASSPPLHNNAASEDGDGTADAEGIPVFGDSAVGDLVPSGGNILDFDRLDSAKHAELLHGILQSSAGITQVVAIFGDWGTGKTSIMQILRGKLDKSEDSYVTVWFNTWLHENDQSLLLSLTDEVRRQILGKPKFLDKAGDAAKAALHFLTLLLRTVKASGDVGIPGLGAANLTVDLSKLPEGKGKDGGEKPLPAAVTEALSDLSLETEQRIVVFLDDLDRCRPNRALEILENLKLVFSQPGFVFVLGIANQDLESYVEHLHKTEDGIDSYNGRYFFEKLIQTSFQVPPLSNQQAERFVMSLPGEENRDLLESVASIVRIAGRNNPRAMKRFANGIIIDRHMSVIQGSDNNIGQVSLADLAVARALREHWIQEYRALLGNETECGDVLKWLDKNDDSSKGFITYATLTGDFDFEAVLQSAPGREWLKNPGRHLAIERWVRPESDQFRNKRHDVYISYRWVDRSVAEKIALWLKRKQLSTMWDARLPVGLNWRKVQEAGLRQSRAMLFLVSDKQHAGYPVVSAFQMSDVTLAVELADAEPEFLIIPVLLYEDSEQYCPTRLLNFSWTRPKGGLNTDELDQQLGDILKILKKNRLFSTRSELVKKKMDSIYKTLGTIDGQVHSLPEKMHSLQAIVTDEARKQSPAAARLNNYASISDDQQTE